VWALFYGLSKKGKDCQKVKRILFIILTLTFSSVFAHDEDVPINTTSELKTWCKTETENYFIAKEKTPHNWTASYHTKGNTLIVEGKWRVEGERKEVKCWIAKGAERKYAEFEISGEK
jgi:hypothetical protein